MITQKQLFIIDQLQAGLSNKEIAIKLNVTEKGVKWHCTNIFKAFNVKSRMQLVAAVRNVKFLPANSLSSVPMYIPTTEVASE